MIFFGIDPGTAITGYGVVRTEGNRIFWVDSGAIVTKPAMTLPEKLLCIYDGLFEKIAAHTPNSVCIEQAFYAKNVHTTLILGHARGAAMLAAVKHGVPVAEFTPREVKKSIVGNGNAEKQQVEYMIRLLLSPPDGCNLPDAFDALAIALCGFYHGVERSVQSLGKPHTASIPKSSRSFRTLDKKSLAALGIT